MTTKAATFAVDPEWQADVEALAFRDRAFAESVDISYISSTDFWGAMRMDSLQRAAFLERIKAHKSAERQAFEAARARAGS